MRKLGLTVLALSACMAAACRENIDSNDVRTSGVYPEIKVVASEKDESVVTVYLKTGGNKSNTYLELKGDDELVATVGDTSKNLDQDGDVSKATFPFNTGGSEFIIAFNRGEDDDSAPASTCTLPEPFNLTGLEAQSTVSRADGVTLTWEPAEDGDTMRWTLEATSGGCLFPSGDKSMTDTGSLTLGPDDFDATQSAKDNGESCDAKVCVERFRKGSLDPAFEEGGEIEAVQRRCINFVSAP